MTLRRQFAFLLVALLPLLSSTTCQKNKPQLPPKMQAPTLAVSVPDQIPEIEAPPESPAPQQEASAQEPPPKKSPPKHHNSKKPAQPAAANQPSPLAPSTQANNTVAANRPPVNPVVESPPPDTAIAAEVSSQQVVRQKQSTAELIESTEKDLKGLNHGLSHDEENMLTQIKTYIAQSRKATTDGDFERAYNLAVKAHLLTDALLKR